MNHFPANDTAAYLSNLSNMWTSAESDLGDIGETHRNPNEEFSFYLAIANGDLESIEQNCEEKHFQAADEGMSVSDYIREQKIERAKNLLRHSDFSLIDIASHLSFSSQSHFIQVFKSLTNITPKAFRDKFYRTHWKTDSDTEDFLADIPNILENTEMKQKASSHKNRSSSMKT